MRESAGFRRRVFPQMLVAQVHLHQWIQNQVFAVTFLLKWISLRPEIRLWRYFLSFCLKRKNVRNITYLVTTFRDTLEFAFVKYHFRQRGMVGGFWNSNFLQVKTFESNFCAKIFFQASAFVLNNWNFVKFKMVFNNFWNIHAFSKRLIPVSYTHLTLPTKA